MNRKSFLTKIGAASAVIAGFPYINVHGNSKTRTLEYRPEERSFGANEQINVALIGTGWMGQVNGMTAAKHKGVKIVAACDLYNSRLERCRELYGNNIFTTKDYREILQRGDVDAVVISTTDHWHDTHAIDSLTAGKSVFLEKTAFG